jgi:hypothetical protein
MGLTPLLDPRNDHLVVQTPQYFFASTRDGSAHMPPSCLTTASAAHISTRLWPDVKHVTISGVSQRMLNLRRILTRTA